MRIRPATEADAAAILAIILPVIRAGETYALDRDMTEADLLAYWLGGDHQVFVAEVDGRILGTYFLHANKAGGGDHVANCGYITDAAASGQGVARTMALHSLERAHELGFRGMQFNFVVSSNERAVRLWTSLGFETVGRLPGAFRHPELGFVDALVMFRALVQEVEMESHQATEEAEIRTIVENWAAAVRRRDLPGVLRHHSPDILMFDVPPPFQSRGIEAYAQTWRTFFNWASEPAVFDFTDMHVTAGSDVAFVSAAMRCMDKEDGALDFRLTMGLRKIEDQWTIVHEHHSVPAAD